MLQFEHDKSESINLFMSYNKNCICTLKIKVKLKFYKITRILSL